MLSPGNLPPQPENRSANPKTEPQKPPQEQPLKCPRCDSSNTKFCYYNNYSLTQPRHFCKTCRRYWTRGGALRNVPIGGGCRKPNKRLKTTTPTPANTTSKLFSGPTGFNFMNPVGQGQGQGQTPAIGFDPAGVYTQFITSTMPMPMPTLSKSGPGPYFGLNLMDLNYSLSLPSPHGNTGGNEHQNSISSIESLSSINQEMHWKLQQQRLAMFYGTASSKTDDDNKGDDDQAKPQGARKVEVGPTEWLFNNQIETSVNNMGISRSNSTDCNNVNEVVGGSNLSGVWGDLLDHHHHHHQHQQQLQFNGLD